MEDQQQPSTHGFTMDEVPVHQNDQQKSFESQNETQIAKPEPSNNSHPVGVTALASSIYPSLDKKPDTVATPISTTPTTQQTISIPQDDKPIPVVKVLSVRGVEYAMMSIALWLSAGTLIFILIALIQGGTSFESLAFPLSMLIVTMPIFGYLYIRLRSAELLNPSLRLEPSKRRFSQITQILAFLTCIFNLIALVYILLSLVGGAEGVPVGKAIGSAIVVLIIAGGILAYYWQDEHKLSNRY